MNFFFALLIEKKKKIYLKYYFNIIFPKLTNLYFFNLFLNIQASFLKLIFKFQVKIFNKNIQLKTCIFFSINSTSNGRILQKITLFSILTFFMTKNKSSPTSA